VTIDESPDAHLDRLMRGLGAIDPKLPPSTHAAILARVIDEHAGEAEHFASAVIEVAPSRVPRRRPLAVALGLAAAAAIAVLWLRPAESPPQEPAMTVVDAGAPPAALSPGQLEPDRIAGNKSIAPDPATRDKMAKDGKDRVVASIKLCVNRQGTVDRVTLLKSSGYPDYDHELVAGVRAWAYRPRSDEVCTAVTFVFTME
jgi:TonB family protein